jgi:hypothetical protein
LQRAHDELHANTLERIGCNKVMQPEAEMGTRLAHSLFNPDVQEYMELTSSFGISRIRIPDRFTNMTLKETGFTGVRDKYGVAVLALKRGDDITLSPDADERLAVADAAALERVALPLQGSCGLFLRLAEQLTAKDDRGIRRHWHREAVIPDIVLVSSLNIESPAGKGIRQ